MHTPRVTSDNAADASVPRLDHDRNAIEKEIGSGPCVYRLDYYYYIILHTSEQVSSSSMDKSLIAVNTPWNIDFRPLPSAKNLNSNNLIIQKSYRFGLMVGW